MFKTLRRYYWVTDMFIRRHGGIIVRTTLVVLAAMGILYFFNRFVPAPLHTIRIGRVGKYSLETLPPDIESKISFGLVKDNIDGSVTPGLAKSWTVSPDGKTYTFTLNPSLTWGDGSKVTADDITYNFQDVKMTKGDGTVTFQLSEPFSPFYSAVSEPLLKNGLWGVGAYRVEGQQSYNGILQSVTLAGPDKLIYKFYPTESSALTAYELGEVDKVEALSFVPSDLTKDTASHVTTDSGERKITVLFFNNNDSLLSAKSTRQALAYAIRDKTFGADRAISPIDSRSWAFNPLVKTYDYDAAHAKSLLSENIKDPSSVSLELKTTLPYLDEAESIASDWQTSLGIQVNVKVVTTVSSDYQALLADFTPPTDPDQYTMWHSTQPTNFTHVTDLKVDKLLEDGRRTLDPKLRKDIYLDFQRFLLEDCPAVFLFNSSSYTISRKPLF